MSEPFEIGLALAFKDGLSDAARRAELHLQCLETVMADRRPTPFEMASIAMAPGNPRLRLYSDRTSLLRDGAGGNGSVGIEEQLVPQLSGQSASLAAGHPEPNRMPVSYLPGISGSTTPISSQVTQVAQPFKPIQVVVGSSMQVNGQAAGLPDAIPAGASAPPAQIGHPLQGKYRDPGDATPSSPGLTIRETGMATNHSMSLNAASRAEQTVSQSPKNSPSAVGTDVDYAAFAPSIVSLGTSLTSADKTNYFVADVSISGSEPASPPLSAIQPQQSLPDQRPEPSSNSATSSFTPRAWVGLASQEMPKAPNFMQQAVDNADQEFPVNPGRDVSHTSNRSLSDVPSRRLNGGSLINSSMYKQPGPHQDIQDAETPRQDNQPINGDIFLDGTLIGRWMSRLLSRDAERASTGPTGYDMRRGRISSDPGAAI